MEENEYNFTRYNETIERILNLLERGGYVEEYFKDCFSLINTCFCEIRLLDIKVNEKQKLIQPYLKYSKRLRNTITKAVKINAKLNFRELAQMNSDLLLLESPYLFDSYMLFIESNRKLNERFYVPRKSQLAPVVNALQDFVDDKLDELFLSLPPRTGKTTLALFFVTWIIGRDSEASNLYSAFSDTITSAFYSGVLEILNDKHTYRWHDIFPKAEIANTNAKEEVLNIDRKKRYSSLTCRSLYGTLNGAADCNGILISDDLIGGIEEALNKDRLIAAWSKVDNNLIPRAKEGAKLLWIGTRWSIGDPIGLRMDLLTNDPNYCNRRYKVVNVPALNEDDESNFNYKFGVGFSTDYYRKRRASFERNNDFASWTAQYMGEPIERDGTLFTPETMQYYNGVLPDKKPDRIFMPCDPAWGGGDFVSAPVLVQYDDTLYCPSVIFDPSDKFITRPRVVAQIIKYKVESARFEKNNGGADYKEWVEEELKKQNYRLNITTKSADTTKRKEQRIFDKAPEIREIYFLENGKRDKDYNLFMQNLFSFKITGKNKNDDAPDSLAMGIEMKQESCGKYEIFFKPF